MTAFQFDMLYSATAGSPGAGTVVLGVSYGNDSVALIQWAAEAGLEQVTCLYNDTGWAMPAHGNHEAWAERVARLEAWARGLGFETAQTASIGFEELVRRKGGFPRQGMQFCTWELKIRPTQEWLAAHDPHGVALCMNGKRRVESVHRAEIPEWTQASLAHGGRRLRQPLYAHDDQARDALIHRSGFDVLPFKSKECMLCINENRVGLVATPEVAIARVERLERTMGCTSKGKPITMFRPARKQGATGIREVRAWAASERGKFRPLSDNTGPSESETGCDGGFCLS